MDTTKQTMKVVFASLLVAACLPGISQAQDITENRGKPWEKAVSGNSEPNIRSGTTESGIINVEGASLTETWERTKTNPDFIDLTDQVQSNDDRLADAESRIISLETLIANAWEEIPTAGAASFTPTGSPTNIGTWLPAISNQTSDFVQSRTYDQNFVSETPVYERNTFTGETRLKETRTSTELRTLNEYRTIDVAQTASGGADGYSSWYNTGSPSCFFWSPSTSTVNSGQTFTQTSNCSVPQRRDIFYLTDGSLIDSNFQTQTGSVTQTRTSVGTKVIIEGIYKYNRIASAIDQNNLPFAGNYGNVLLKPCGPLGKEVYAAYSVVTGSPNPSYWVYRCETP